MVKLSAELIEQAAQYTNPIRDRELDLRGNANNAKANVWALFPFVACVERSALDSSHSHVFTQTYSAHAQSTRRHLGFCRFRDSK